MRPVLRSAIGLATAVWLVGCGALGQAPATATDDPALEAVIATAEGSVAKVLATRCDAGPIPGSAFVVGPGLLLTAAHVVTGSRQVAVALPGGTMALAEVAGLDPSADTALLRTTAELPAALPLLTDPATVGAPMALIGHPLGGDDVSATQGVITSTGDQVVVNGFDMNRLLTVDVEVAPGNSGGPALDRSGAVAGMIVARMGGKPWRDRSAQVTVAIPAAVLAEHLAGWPDPVAVSPCPGEADAAGQPPLIGEESIDDEPVLTVWLLAAGLNAGQYPSSWQLLTPAARLGAGSFEAWQREAAGTRWRSLQIDSTQREGERAAISLRAEAMRGETCIVLAQEYQLRRVDGIWLIDQLSQRPDGTC